MTKKNIALYKAGEVIFFPFHLLDIFVRACYRNDDLYSKIASVITVPSVYIGLAVYNDAFKDFETGFFFVLACIFFSYFIMLGAGLINAGFLALMALFSRPCIIYDRCRKRLGKDRKAYEKAFAGAEEKYRRAEREKSRKTVQKKQTGTSETAIEDLIARAEQNDHGCLFLSGEEPADQEKEEEKCPQKKP